MKYKTITFAKELDCSLADFKKMFSRNQAFLEVPSLDRDKELKKVHAKLMKANGKLSNSTNKSKTAKASNRKEKSV